MSFRSYLLKSARQMIGIIKCGQCEEVKNRKCSVAANRHQTAKRGRLPIPKIDDYAPADRFGRFYGKKRVAMRCRGVRYGVSLKTRAAVRRASRTGLRWARDTTMPALIKSIERVRFCFLFPPSPLHLWSPIVKNIVGCGKTLRTVDLNCLMISKTALLNGNCAKQRWPFRLFGGSTVGIGSCAQSLS